VKKKSRARGATGFFFFFSFFFLDPSNKKKGGDCYISATLQGERMNVEWNESNASKLFFSSSTSSREGILN
jgi:hypothetical protein